VTFLREARNQHIKFWSCHAGKAKICLISAAPARAEVPWRTHTTHTHTHKLTQTYIQILYILSIHTSQAPHSTDRSRRASSPVKGAVDPDAEDSTAFTNTLMDVRAAPPNSMPANNGHLGFVQYHQQQQQQQQLHSSKAHPHGAGDSSSPMDEDDRWPSTGR
jgi:hypothetical protein